MNSLKIDMDYPLGLANLMCEPDSYEILYVFNLFGVVIRLDRYSDEDKMVIARDYLIPELKERFLIYNDQFTNGLDAFSDEEFLFTEKELRCIIGDYCQDAGVRNLKNSLEKLVRYAKRYASKSQEKLFSVDKIRDILEPTVYRARNGQ